MRSFLERSGRSEEERADEAPENVGTSNRNLRRRKSRQEARRRERATFLRPRHFLVAYCLEIIVTREIGFSPGPGKWAALSWESYKGREEWRSRSPVKIELLR